MNQPLEGRTVAVTRAASQAGELSTLLENYGAKVFSCPTIEIREPDNYDRLDEALDHLYGYDWLIFTSTNGVRFFLQRLADRGLSVADLDEIRVCAIGRRTANQLHDAHVHVDLVPSQSTAEGVFTALSEFTGGREHLRGLNILLPRAAVGRDVLPKELEQAGARVDVVTAYQTVVPENFDRGRLSAMLAGATDDGVCLLEFTDRPMLPTQLATLRHRLGRPIVAGRHPHLDSLAAELDEYFAGTRAAFDVPLVTPGTPVAPVRWAGMYSNQAWLAASLRA